MMSEREPQLLVRTWNSITAHWSPYLVLYGRVNLIDQPGERVSVDGFSQSISGVEGVVDRERAEDLPGESLITSKFQLTGARWSLNAPGRFWPRSFGMSALPGD